MGQPEQVAPQKPNCVRTALQKQIDILKLSSNRLHKNEVGHFNVITILPLEDAIRALEDLEVALTDCYKSQ